MNFSLVRIFLSLKNPEVFTPSRSKPREKLCFREFFLKNCLDKNLKRRGFPVLLSPRAKAPEFFGRGSFCKLSP
ncbi:hypothetical protein A2818_02055 [Candidatus Nomurabacteria bacterium RIFCSPHIGHO2_01_FULL_40_12]|uniref:Uncharacterized protein n=1 Tax=Candidatus Nomurabacteria bacterium RIFCSPHIGHO2_01_FULL_40_12 TaxID=1801737 RepID=A0A1F6UZS7_9BACT|nr:MAG: hypothetical protein A2818_02055 [Candidatus Nomurabacteria bacterium RIFCSPHIGHO2_01_FULL_40_12]